MKIDKEKLKAMTGADIVTNNTFTSPILPHVVTSSPTDSIMAQSGGSLGAAVAVRSPATIQRSYSTDICYPDAINLICETRDMDSMLCVSILRLINVFLGNEMSEFIVQGDDESISVTDQGLIINTSDPDTTKTVSQHHIFKNDLSHYIYICFPIEQYSDETVDAIMSAGVAQFYSVISGLRRDSLFLIN